MSVKKTHNPEYGLRLALSKGPKKAGSPFPLLHLKTEANAAMSKFSNTAMYELCLLF